MNTRIWRIETLWGEGLGLPSYLLPPQKVGGYCLCTYLMLTENWMLALAA